MNSAFDFCLERASAEWSLVWMRECLVNSSDRENLFSQPGKVQANGFSPVCVRMWRVCSRVSGVCIGGVKIKYLVLQSTECSATGGVGTFVGAGYDLFVVHSCWYGHVVVKGKSVRICHVAGVKLSDLGWQQTNGCNEVWLNQFSPCKR